MLGNEKRKGACLDYIAAQMHRFCDEKVSARPWAEIGAAHLSRR
jgi:hypothetical protein